MRETKQQQRLSKEHPHKENPQKHVCIRNTSAPITNLGKFVQSRPLCTTLKLAHKYIYAASASGIIYRPNLSLRLLS